jgi:hypothetical protein
MNKSSSTKSGKTKAAPDKLSKTGKKSGIELSETQLGQASGGANFLKIKLT